MKVYKFISAIALFIFSIVMLNTIFQYTTFEKSIGFLQFKQDVVNNPYWLLFFYIHIFSIILCLLAGLTQFSNIFLTENPKLHRIIGKIYVYNILIINFPACFVLSIFSNGGMLGIIGFLLQNFLWAYFTILAVIYIKKGNINKHRIYMILSYSITTTAITFRIIKNIFYQENLFSYHLFYGINVWMSLLFNLLIAYIIIATNKSKTLSLKGKSINQNNK